MWVEALTVMIIGGIAVASIFKLPPVDAKEIALTLGGVLGGYLTKTAVDMIKSKITGTKPVESITVEGGTNG